MTPIELQLAVERLLALEAYLLDAKRFPEWLDLFTEDATYTVSVRELVQPQDEGAPSIALAEPPLVAENRQFLTTRVQRLDTRLAHAEQPPSLTRHLITGILIIEDRGDELRVASSFQVYQARVDISEHVFYGQRDDLLRKVDGDWKIAHRHAILDTALLPRTLSIFF
jgi:3-phenylpropionate/cinnamic acid dioxygenase small subunit